ncbi:MAG: hypothetical protein AAF826_03945 [Pseudomonadota bacterium]
MEILIPIGAVIALAGLVGLIICIIRAMKVRKEGLEGEALTERLRPLVTLNMIALFGSVIGLMCVILGISFG